MELDSIYSDVAGVCGHVNAQQARLVRLTQRVVSEHVWEESGCRTAAHWLAWQTGTASSTARKILGGRGACRVSAGVDGGVRRRGTVARSDGVGGEGAGVHGCGDVRVRPSTRR
ncbi:MAG: hypothetical protein WKF58_09430 [Ilumatobacteraceae bacterium]